MVITEYSDICKKDLSLRQYQQKAKEEIFESWDEVDNVMFQMPTGTGKTRLFTSIISDINKYSIQRKEAVKILIVAHRTELISQISKHLEKYKVPHNIIVGGKEKNYKYPVSVASIQTITNRHNIEQAKKLKIQFVIIDEAHHALAASYKKLWDMYPDAKRLGVTATPWRMNHQSFTDLFDKLVMSMPIKDFIKQGHLAPYKYYSLRDDSYIQKTIDGIELDKFGEYKESSMEEKMDIGSIRAQLLNSYLSLAKGKKGIIYAINIAHAKHICEEYQKAGYKAVSIDSKTPSEERHQFEQQFRKGEIDIIVNVDIFSEGYDCPDIEFIQLARPTCSLVKYLQQVGRGLRPTDNKENCIILDNVGMYSRFGLPDARRHWKYHFIGKDIDEEPKKVVSKGTGKSRYVDLSEGTEDMELIQDDYEGIEAPKATLAVEDDLFPVFGVTLGITTLEEALNLGGEEKIDEDTGDLYCDIENVQFYSDNNIINWIYWTKDDRDFPNSWKTKGFYWENSYDAWLDIFRHLGYRIEIDNNPEQKEYGGRITLCGSFEAWSPDNTISFFLNFKHGEKGYFTSSPSTLLLMSIHYHESTIDSIDDVYDEEEEEEGEEIEYEEVVDAPMSAVNDFFPLFGVTLGETTWQQARDMGYEVRKWEKGPSRTMDVEEVDFWDHEGEGIFTSLYWTRDESDFPLLWKSHGFNWILSYDAWIEVFVKLGYIITVTHKPVQKKYSRRDTLSAEFEAVSPDGTLNFIMDFNYGEQGCYTSSPSTLYSITIDYKGKPTEGGLKFQESTSSFRVEGKDQLTSDDVSKLKHTFDKKSTSYKYFWFISLLEVYKEYQVEKIVFDKILIKMAAKAWKYVFMLNGQFSQSDQFPTYLSHIRTITGLKNNSSESEVEDELNLKYDYLNIKSILSPLLKNVPYRFLSPWIPFTYNDEVMEKSWNKGSRSPYKLYNDHVIINEIWKEDIIDNYDSFLLLAEYGLETYLKIDQNLKEPIDFYNTRFTSLTQLLKGIKRRKGQEVVKLFLEKYNFPSSGDIRPTELMEKMPDSSCVIGSDGHKRANIPGDMWSLKILDKMLSKEKLINQYKNVDLFEKYGLDAYLKSQETTKAQNLYETKYISLNKLLKAIKTNKDEKVVKTFLGKYDFPSTGAITPADLMSKMPESNCVIDNDGRKRVILPGNMWSLKLLDKLLSE